MASDIDPSNWQLSYNPLSHEHNMLRCFRNSVVLLPNTCGGEWRQLCTRRRRLGLPGINPVVSTSAPAVALAKTSICMQVVHKVSPHKKHAHKQNLSLLRQIALNNAKENAGTLFTDLSTIGRMLFMSLLVLISNSICRVTQKSKPLPNDQKSY